MFGWTKADYRHMPEPGRYVTVKVADYSGNYRSIAKYDARTCRWQSVSGVDLNDNVYAWKRTGLLMRICTRIAICMSICDLEWY